MIAIATLLAGCGGSDGAGSDPSAVAAAASWDARDACASLGHDNASALGGAPVSDTKLEVMSVGGGGLAAASMCTFTYANGATLMIVAREAPDGDATPAAIENARTAGGLVPPADPVPGLGKAAVWSASARQAQLFIDDRRYVVINFFKLPPGEDARARSLAVAKAFL